jgi:hypothetical protein
MCARLESSAAPTGTGLLPSLDQDKLKRSCSCQPDVHSLPAYRAGLPVLGVYVGWRLTKAIREEAGYMYTEGPL